MRFGTDGIRGLANAELTPELALALGRAAVAVLGGDRILVGRDPRRSGPMLEAAFAAGVCSAGARAELLGVLPTPAVACLSAVDAVPAAMISASHNPFDDNGIKLFSAGGRKLPDDVQAELEAEVERLLSGSGRQPPVGEAVGVVEHVEGRASERYEEAVLAALEGRGLGGRRVVLDCAHGASSAVAPEVFAKAGAEVSVICASPDGVNINDGCGSTHPGRLQAEVVARRADVGFAFDGDADRVVAVDRGGELVDGDQLIALCAIDLNERGRLRDEAVVVTVMTNLGFHQGMSRHGIRVVETQVGDRYVLEALDAGRLSLGGEQSGHVIFRDLATTGDGLLTAVLVADVMERRGLPLHELAAGAMVRLPQVLVNVRLSRRLPDLMERLAPDVAAAEARLGAEGRVLVRPSGTEPVVRIMVEAPEEDIAGEITASLARAVEAMAR